MIWRADTRAAASGCNAPRLGRPADAAAAAADQQVVDPLTAYQIVHMLEGVVQRGTATSPARPRPAAVRQDRHDHRPDQRLVRRRLAGHRRRRLYGLRPAAADGRLCPGRHAGRADLQASSRGPRSKACRWCRSARRRASAWSGSTAARAAACSAPGRATDPRAAVIWEAFKPESEPRRTVAPRRARPQRRADAARRARRRAAPTQRDSDFLQRRGRDLLGLPQAQASSRRKPGSSLDTGHLDPGLRRGTVNGDHQCAPKRKPHIDQIRSALDLLRRFLDWDRALRRLDELNARVEDPTLWNDPKARAGGDARAAPARRGDRRDPRDRAGAGRHGRADGDGRGRGRRGAGRRRRRRAGRARRARRARQGRRPARRRGRRQRHLYRGQCRRRRHREPGLGRRCSSACTRAGPSGTA